MTTDRLAGPNPAHGFRHEALLYAGDDELVAAATAFMRGAILHDEPVMVVLCSQKLARVREELATDTHLVRFEALEALGPNPARLIPAWREFLDEHGGGDKPLRGIGEPIGPDSQGADLDERQHHEVLANLAFADVGAFWVLCPYDTSRLPADVIERACITHPRLRHRDESRSSPTFRDQIPSDGASWGDPLTPPCTQAAVLKFGLETLHQLRAFVGVRALRYGLCSERADDLVLAVNELASNSIRYGGGSGMLRMWEDDHTVLCEVQDRGHITDPLAGRRPPRTFGDTSRGLWVVNQLCDLVQIRTSAEGTTIRLHMHTPAC